MAQILLKTDASETQERSINTELSAQNANNTELYNGKADIGPFPAAVSPALTVPAYLHVGMDSERRLLRGGAANTLQRSVEGSVWENIYTFTRPVSGVRQLDNGEILVGLSHDYPANTIKASVWLSSGYAGESPTFTQVLEADDYQQNLDLSWGFGGAGSTYAVSSYDGKAPGTRSGQQRVWLTQDSGVTWAPIYDHGTGVPSHRHIHGCCYDHYRQAIWVSVGDGSSAEDTKASGIIVSWDLGVTWAVVTYQHQPTVIYAFKDCVVFGTDGSPNGVLRIDDPSESNVVVDVAHLISRSLVLEHIAIRPYRLGEGYPLLIPYKAAMTGSGLTLATYDGYEWFELWSDDRTYTGQGPANVFGPTQSNEYFITGTDGSGYFQTIVAGIENSLLTALSRAKKASTSKGPRMSYIAMANTADFVLTPSEYLLVTLNIVPSDLKDYSYLFEIPPDGTGVIVRRDCIARISINPPFPYNATSTSVYLILNGTLTAISATFDAQLHATIMLVAGDQVGLKVRQKTAGGITLDGSDYCLTIEANEH